VLSCSVDRQDNIWIGTDSDARRFDGEGFTTLGAKDGLPSGGVSPIIQDRSGHMLFGTGAGLSRYDGDKFTHFTTEDGLAHNSVFNLIEDREGRIWIQTQEGINIYDGGQLADFAPEDSLGRLATSLMIEDRRGHPAAEDARIRHRMILTPRAGMRASGRKMATSIDRSGRSAGAFNLRYCR
jgi:ligand-binding sensor domain-containing protein